MVRRMTARMPMLSVVSRECARVTGKSPADKDDPLRGIGWMLLTMASIAAQDAVGKYLSQFYPVPYVVWARFLGHFLVVAILLAPRFATLFRTVHPGLQALRSVLLYSLSLTYILGMTFMTLAESTAIMFLSPMMVTLLSVPLMSEKVGMRRIGAIVAGFIGAMIIIRPGFGAIQWAGLLPLTAALCLALYQIANRVVSRDDAALTSLFLSSIGGVIVFEPFGAGLLAHSGDRTCTAVVSDRRCRRGDAFCNVARLCAGAGFGGRAVHLYAADLGDHSRLSDLRRICRIGGPFSARRSSLSAAPTSLSVTVRQKTHRRSIEPAVYDKSKLLLERLVVVLETIGRERLFGVLHLCIRQDDWVAEQCGVIILPG